MDITQIMTSKRSVFKVRGKLDYILMDKIGILTFILLLAKTLIFMNVLKSKGAATLKGSLDTYSLLNSYIYILFIIMAMSFTYLFHKRAHLCALVIVNILYTTLLIGDLWIYRGFNSFLSLHLLTETSNLNNMSEGVMSMARPIDILFIVDIILIIVLSILSAKRYKLMDKCRGIFSILFLFSLAFVLFFHVIYDYHGSQYDGPMLFKTQWINYATMRNLSPIGYHIYDTVMFVDDNRPFKLNADDKKSINTWLDYKNENLPDNKYAGIFKGKNVIVIQVESLENFILNNKYGNQEITPNLNKMLNNSLYFPNYYEQVNNGTSSDADLMTNASVYPVRRGSTFFRFPDNKYNTMPDILKNLGYSTGAYHADYGYYWNVRNALANFGFDKFMDISDFPKKDGFYMGLTDQCFLSQVSDIVSAKKQPFYAFCVTTTSHMPFNNINKRPDMVTMNLPKAFADTHMGGYYECFHYTDAQIGNFIDGLDKKGLLDNTVVVIYGDHTSIHKYYSDEVSKMQPQESWWNNGFRIPLIIYSKGMKGEVIPTNGGQIDLMPTLAYTLGIDKNIYQNTTMGRNLLNTNKSYAILSNGTIIGKENLNKQDIEHVDESFDIADKITRADYFNKNKK